MNWFDALFLSKPQQPPAAPSTTSNTRPDEKRLLELPTTQQNPETSSTDIAPRTTSFQPRVIFAAGLAFSALSLLITRRSFVRKRLASSPAFYTNSPSHHQHQSQTVSGGMEALEALNIATVNVLSLAMLSSGGLLWYFDINSMEEARRKLRGGLGVDGSGRTEGDAEEEFEEWMASVLTRKEKKEVDRDTRERWVNERGRER